MAEEIEGNPSIEHPQHAPTEGSPVAAPSHAPTGLEREGPSLATAALVGVGVALVEPELIPGMLIGAGAVLAPKLIPALGSMLRPMVKGVVKAGYSVAMTVREYAAEAGEQVEDIMAEARAEHAAGSAAADQPPAPEHASRRQRRQGPRTPAPATNL